MNKWHKYLILALSLPLSFTVLSCNLASTSNAAISLNLGSNGAQTRSALPALDYQWQSITVEVSGPGMPSMSQTFTLDGTSTSIELQVPTGSARTFKVTAIPSDPDGIYAVTEFAANQTIDVIANAENIVDLELKPSNSRIVIPDARNKRIVMIDSLANGLSTWKTLTAADIDFDDPALATNFYPQDVEIDERGSIIVAYGYEYSGVDSVGGILAIDHFGSAQSPLSYVNIASTPTLGVTYSSENKTLYALSQTVTSMPTVRNLYSYYMGGESNANPVELSIQHTPSLTLLLPTYASRYVNSTTFASVGSIAVDSDGSIYTIVSESENSYIAKLSLTGMVTFLKNIDEIGLQTGQRISDLRFVENKLFGISIALNSPYSQGELFELDPSSLTIIRRYGYPATAPSLPSDAETTLNLIQPRAFAAVLNKKLVIIDEGGNTLANPQTRFNRLLALNSDSFSDPEIFGQNGNGTGQFEFYTAFTC